MSYYVEQRPQALIANVLTHTQARGSTMASTISRRVDKLLTSSAHATHSSDFIASLLGVSSALHQTVGDDATVTSATARRVLRSALQRQALQQCDELIDDFAHVERELLTVEQHVVSLHSQCSALTDRIGAAKAQTQSVLDQTKALVDKKTGIDTRRRAVMDFLAHVQLSPVEQAMLTPSDQPFEISAEFFDVLTRIQRVRDECRSLQSTQHQRVALDVMDDFARRLEIGYEKLMHWAQQHMRSNLDAASPEPSPLLARALQVLMSRPVYFEHCASELCSVRRVALVRRFTQALSTNSNTNVAKGAARPIEVHAHDPFRYVSDMLAWLHEAMAAERDLFQSLFESIGDSGVLVPLMLHKVFEGLLRPLRVRVEQAISTQPSLLLVFQLQHLLDFQCSTVSTFLSPLPASFFVESSNQFVMAMQNKPQDNQPTENHLHDTLAELRSEARRVFFELASQQAQRIVSAPPAAPYDLSVPPQLLDALHRVEQLARVQNSSMLPLTAERATDFNMALGALLDPLLQCVDSVAQPLDVSDGAVFTLNVVAAAKTTLQSLSCASTRCETLTALIESKAEVLVKDQVTQLLRRCGLADKLQRLNENKRRAPAVPLSSIDGMDAASLAVAFKAFYAQVFALGSMVTPQCDRVVNPQLKAAVRLGIARLLASTHAALHKAVHSEFNGYGTKAAEFASHAPRDIVMLLDCDAA